MNNVEININLGGDAFVKDIGELPRILRELADIIENNHTRDRTIFDTNGNPVGQMIFNNYYVQPAH